MKKYQITETHRLVTDDDDLCPKCGRIFNGLCHKDENDLWCVGLDGTNGNKEKKQFTSKSKSEAKTADQEISALREDD